MTGVLVGSALIQWSLLHPQDWVDVTDPSTWRNLPSKPAPVGGEVLDDVPGWVCAICVQGVDFEGYDHYAVAVLRPKGFQIIAWNDDPIDHAGDFHAMIWTFNDPGPDARYGGRVNTHQALEVYQQAQHFPADLTTSDGPAVYHAWADFVPPTTKAIRHGVWMTDEQFAAHQAARTSHPWTDWSP